MFAWTSCTSCTKVWAIPNIARVRCSRNTWPRAGSAANRAADFITILETGFESGCDSQVSYCLLAIQEGPGPFCAAWHGISRSRRWLKEFVSEHEANKANIDVCFLFALVLLCPSTFSTGVPCTVLRAMF